MPQYLKITITCSPEKCDLLIAELGMISYDSFQELNDGLEAYIEEKYFIEDTLREILDKYDLASQFTSERIDNINWNEEWEKNFDPVYIDDKVQIRATFHEKKEAFIHDVVINPKMSFGTGHHETTCLIISEQLSINHKDKEVLDVGTGTGILAIMADKLGAKSIIATDVDEWCIENSLENFQLNELQNFNILRGSIDKLTFDDHFDIILANINKNVLINELPYYSELLSIGGFLVLSGFYVKDMDDLKRKANECNLKFDHDNSRNDWAMVVLTK